MNQPPGSAAWKASRYITMVEAGSGDALLIFAGFTGRLLEVPAGLRKTALDLLQAPDQIEGNQRRELHTLFREQGVLIPGAFDELEYLRERHEQAKHVPSSMLGLTICPTLNCNFRCSYCYQRHPSGVMSREIQDRIVSYVQNHRPPLKNLSVTWFGGEPLLELPAIERLTMRFLDLQLDYQASIITNGSLLTNKVSRTLLALRVLWAQVTLDGPREIHDGRRRMTGKQATFDTIVDNIAAADPDLVIVVRVNLDKRNFDQVPALFDQLDASGLRGRVSVYFAPVCAYTEVCADVTAYCMTGRSWPALQPPLQLLALERGYGSPGLPRARRHVCLADRASDLVVVPSGLIFKCWNDVTNPAQAIFDFSVMARTPQMEENLSRWLDWGPFNFPDCETCPVLPLCMGGCPHISIRRAHGACKELKNNLKETLLLHYLDYKRKQSIGQLKKLIVGTIGDKMCRTGENA